MFGIKKGYQVVEVIKEETKTTWGEEILRTITYDTLEEAQEAMKGLKPKENGTLKIREKVWMC